MATIVTSAGSAGQCEPFSSVWGRQLLRVCMLVGLLSAGRPADVEDPEGPDERRDRGERAPGLQRHLPEGVGERSGDSRESTPPCPHSLAKKV